MNKLIFGIASILVVACSSARPYDPNAPCYNGDSECVDTDHMNYCVDGVWELRSCLGLGTGYHCEYVPTIDKGRCFAPGQHWTSLK